MDIKELINEKVDKDFVIKLMKELGTDYRQFGSDIRFLPVCHGGDKYTLVYYDDTKLFNCLTHCGYMGIIDVVSKAKNIDWASAMRFLCGRLGINVRNGLQVAGSGNLSSMIEEAESCLINTSVRNKNTFYDDTILRFFSDRRYIDWAEENISYESLEKFEVKWYDMKNEIVIPCRDVEGHLIGIRRRSTDPDEPNKYMPLFMMHGNYVFNTGANLYGIYQNQDIIKKQRRVIVFEGEKSVLKADTIYGEYPSVATYGSAFTNEQIIKLLELGVQEIILAYDYDKSGERAKFDKIAKRIISYKGVKCSYILPREEDKYDEFVGNEDGLRVHDAPIDRGQHRYEELMRKRIRIKN